MSKYLLSKEITSAPAFIYNFGQYLAEFLLCIIFQSYFIIEIDRVEVDIQFFISFFPLRVAIGYLDKVVTAGNWNCSAKPTICSKTPFQTGKATLPGHFSKFAPKVATRFWDSSQVVALRAFLYCKIMVPLLLMQRRCWGPLTQQKVIAFHKL